MTVVDTPPKPKRHRPDVFASTSTCSLTEGASRPRQVPHLRLGHAQHVAHLAIAALVKAWLRHGAIITVSFPEPRSGQGSLRAETGIELEDDDGAMLSDRAVGSLHDGELLRASRQRRQDEQAHAHHEISMHEHRGDVQSGCERTLPGVALNESCSDVAYMALCVNLEDTDWLGRGPVLDDRIHRESKHRSDF